MFLHDKPFAADLPEDIRRAYGVVERFSVYVDPADALQAAAVRDVCPNSTPGGPTTSKMKSDRCGAYADMSASASLLLNASATVVSSLCNCDRSSL
jgi:hypothetical protein